MNTNTDGSKPSAEEKNTEEISSARLSFSNDTTKEVETDAEISDAEMVIKAMNKDGKFVYIPEKKDANLVFIYAKKKSIAYVFDGVGRSLGFTTRFNLLVSNYIDDYVAELYRTISGEKEVTNKAKIKLKNEIEEFLIYKTSNVERGTFSNNCVYLDGNFYKKTDYEKNIFITKNFEDILEQVKYIETYGDEVVEYFHTLQKLFGENYLKLCAFIVAAMLGDEGGNKPILFLTGNSRVGKSSAGRLIERIVEGKNRIVSPTELEKILPEVLGSRIALFDDVSTKERKTDFFNILKRISTSVNVFLNQRYSKSGISLSCNSFFICSSVDTSLFEFDKQLENRVIKISINKIEYAKKNMALILKNEELIQKIRGVFYQIMPFVLYNLPLDGEIVINKRYDLYMRILYALKKTLYMDEKIYWEKFPEQGNNQEFEELNNEESEVEINEDTRRFLKFILDYGNIEKKEGAEIINLYRNWIISEITDEPKAEKILKDIPNTRIFFKKILCSFEGGEIKYLDKIIEHKSISINIRKADGTQTTKRGISFLITDPQKKI
ncbi:MAG: hypothetical protein BWK75_04475 [Candidatus Altiarchaeales archaeon A3]|nr:MAG: hypothetical protein BWK75_04475 [Candidatus Altiarchaeales archaeon A3]